MSLPRSILRQPTLRSQLRSLHVTAPRPRPHSGTVPPSRAGSTSNGAGVSGVAGAANAGSSAGAKKPPSPHLVWYREIVPAMIPILLLSSTIFLSLTLVRTHLSHSLSLSESSARIAELETQLDTLRKRQARQRERDRKERERILPLVVERVLQKVGAMSEEEEEEEAEADLPFLV